MATYVIGDVQGCFAKLQALLERCNFNPEKDHLAFAGDLINRGPQSLETLRFIKSLPNVSVVLGNHDIYLLMLGYECVEFDGEHTLHDIFDAADKFELLDWLRQQPLCYADSENNWAIVHAGIPPQWSLADALKYSAEFQQAMQCNDFRDVLAKLEGNQPDQWHESLTGIDRLRYIVNALTRMRFCDQAGKLELTCKGKPSDNPEGFAPWFSWPRQDAELDLCFGHWAALEAKLDHPYLHALDTGAVYGGALTAWCVEAQERISV